MQGHLDAYYISKIVGVGPTVNTTQQSADVQTKSQNEGCRCGQNRTCQCSCVSIISGALTRKRVRCSYQLSCDGEVCEQFCKLSFGACMIQGDERWRHFMVSFNK